MKDSNKKDFESDRKDEEEITRVRIPKDNELLGVVVQRLGANKMEVMCSDGKLRNCRVPGRFKRKFWLREGNFVIIAPWEFDNLRADILYQYKNNEVIQLKKRGLLRNLEGY